MERYGGKALFQSTPPVREATDIHKCIIHNFKISIHASREGGDGKPGIGKSTLLRFQSTPPVREATMTPSGAKSFRKFQSTPPVREATVDQWREANPKVVFQSTPPVREATRAPAETSRGASDFNPRLP